MVGYTKQTITWPKISSIQNSPGGYYHGDNQSHTHACGEKVYSGIIHRPGDSVCEESGKDPG